jgi:hypothetical protein
VRVREKEKQQEFEAWNVWWNKEANEEERKV